MWYRYIQLWQIVFVSIGILLSPVPAIAGGADSFNAGVKAYREGKYQEAANLFERARKEGVRKVSVYFNLGSSYYRLGQYEKATAMFEMVTKSKSMADIGYFNLGLIARQQGNIELAKAHFNRAIASSTNKKIIYLANKNIEEIDTRLGVWSGYAVAEAGYDDNVANSALGPASGGDAYAVLRAGTGSLLGGTRKKGWAVFGNIYSRSYSTISSYNLASVAGGVKRYMPILGRSGYIGGHYKVLTLGGAAYENISGFEIGTESRIKSGAQYRYEYNYDSIGAAAAYNYLQGTRQRLQMERQSRLDKNSTLSLRYRFELNDRQNSGTASYSNVRNGIRAIYKRHTDSKTRWLYSAQYRFSDYTPVAAQNRDDSMVRLTVLRTAAIGKNLEWTAKYTLTRNDSTDSAYTYLSNVYQIGISKHF